MPFSLLVGRPRPVEPGAVHVADFIAMRMMAPVICGPAQDRRLDRHLRHRAENILHRDRGIERLVRIIAVEAEHDPEHQYDIASDEGRPFDPAGVIGEHPPDRSDRSENLRSENNRIFPALFAPGLAADDHAGMRTGLITLLGNAIFLLIFITKITCHLFTDLRTVTLWSFAVDHAYSLNAFFCEPNLHLADFAKSSNIYSRRVFFVTPLGIESGAAALTPYLVTDSFRSPAQVSVNH